MSIATELLFLNGHIVDPKLAIELATSQPARTSAQPHPESPMKTFPTHLFKSLWYLGGLDDLNPRADLGDEAYGPSYGNRIASRRAFDTYARRRERRIAATPVAVDRRACA